MALEDDIHRTFEALAATLRDELSRQLEAIDSDLAAAVREERSRVLAAAEQERVEALALAAGEHQQVLSAARAEAADRARQEVLEQAEKDTAARVAEAEARARHSGFEDGRAEALEAARAQALEIARAEALELDEARSVEAACEAELALATWIQRACARIDACGSLSEIFDGLAASAAEQSGRASVLVLERRAFRVQAVAGSGENRSHPGVNAVIPAAESGAIAAALKNRAAVVAAGAEAVPRAFGPVASDVETAAVPLIVGGTVVAVLCGERRADERAARRIADVNAWAAALDTAARYAARGLEALTASRAAQLAAASRPAAGDASIAAPPREDEEQAARRYARLLISEIKLYHEPDVIAGRRERDLASRLGGEIMRARALYDQRVSARTRGGADYFNEELIRTLADGDASLLA